MLSLLRHLELVGFDGCPRVVGDGLLPDGRMRLTFAPGSSAHPKAWSDGAYAAIGALLRRAHDASASFELPRDAVWAESWLREVGAAEDDLVIGHGDAAPWNLVGPSGHPTALIDWDLAGPISRLTEVAYAVWLNAQLHDDDIADMHGLPDASTRARQAREIIEAYGLEQAQRAILVDRMIEVAVESARADAIAYNVTPASSDAVAPSGFPVLWSVTWRVRSAAWMLRNRRLLTNTITY